MAGSGPPKGTQMTVSSTLNKIIYAGDGATVTFGFAFSVDASSSIQVFFTDATGIITQLATNLYTVTVNAAAGVNPTPVGGSVTYPLTGSAIAIGTSLTILRTLLETQSTSLANQGTLYQPVIEAAIDRAIMIDQQVNELVGRNLTVAVSDTTPGLLPTATARALKVLGFDASGNPIAVSSAPAGTISSAMAPVVAAATIAAAQALLGIQALGYATVGEVKEFIGLTAPQTYFLCRGQTVSRASFPELFAVCCPVFTGLSIISGNPAITMPARADGLQPTTGMFAGMKIESSGIIPPGTSILSLTNTAITLTANPGSNGSTLTLFLYGNGDGSTTYNLPDDRGYTIVGMDPQNGTSRMTKSTSQGTDASGLGNVGGEQAHTQTSGEMATHNHVVNITDTHSHNVPNIPATGNSGTISASAQNLTSGVQTLPTTGTIAGSITAASVNTGGGGAHNNTQPTSIRNKIIYAGRNTF